MNPSTTMTGTGRSVLHRGARTILACAAVAIGLALSALAFVVLVAGALARRLISAFSRTYSPAPAGSTSRGIVIEGEYEVLGK